MEKRLEAAPTLEAKALFEWLCEEHPGRYQPVQRFLDTDNFL
jgi:hypothetical protein